MKRCSILTTGLVAMASLSLAACGGGSDPMAEGTSAEDGATNSGGSSIIVGSANFPENQLLAEIYAQALEADGLDVQRQLNIASRETYLNALNDGSIDLIPEYSGNLARYYDPEADISTSEAAVSSLKAALPNGLTVLEPAPAEDKDSVVVTSETAQEYGLESIADLSEVASELVLGGPPEWQERVDGVPGLKRVYGLSFKSFKPLDAAGALTVQALANGQVDAANLFSTNPQIAENNFVVLDDPEGLFGAQNVIPLIVEDKATDQVSGTLNEVNAAIDTERLTDLVGQVVIEKSDVEDVATQFLDDEGLGQ